MDSSTIRCVGVVGLGRMGLPMARHLLRAGFVVVGFDVDPARLTALADVRGTPLASVGEVAARCDAVLLMVTDDAQVREITLGSDGVLHGMGRGRSLIISSTVRPSTCREVAAAAAKRGIGVLDAPVSKGQRSAEAGTLTVFVGGEGALFQRCRAIFEAFAKEIVHIGERVGAGQVAKLTNNLILWASVVAVHEALTFADRLGVSPARLRTALRAGSADCYALRELHLINLTWPHKDIAQAMEVAAEEGGTLALTNCVDTLIRTLTREDLRRLCSTTAEGQQDPPRA